MKHVNIEIKARSNDLRRARRILKSCGAVRSGVDRQIDTYFSVESGRLKLREGQIENSLIHYKRAEDDRLRLSDITRCDTGSIGRDIKEVLLRALPPLAVVDKKREIYFVDNVKFHLDRVAGLGTFVEIEAIDVDGSGNVAMLRRQCDEFMELLGIRDGDLVHASYSDMILDEHVGDEPILEAAA